MKRSFARNVLPLLCVALLASCLSDWITSDDWGTSGYARVVGTAHFTNGTPVANRPVSYACGPESPTLFGYRTTTNATGAFAVNIEAPGEVVLPGSGLMVCRFRAPADTVPLMSLELSIPFSARKSERPTTTIALVQP